MQARLLNHSYQQDVDTLMKRIGVDDYGVRIMRSKSLLRIIYLRGVSSFSANVLKQETLSLGADVALPRRALFQDRPTECILFATDSQIEKLLKKLKVQPHSLKEIGALIRQSLVNFRRDNFILKTPGHTLHINKPLVMGILNLTPDSFSGDGLIRPQAAGLPAACLPARQGRQGFKLQDILLKRVTEMVKDGADLIDVGGESTRPGSRAVSEKEELERIVPAVKMIRKRFSRMPISIDTRKPKVARAAVGEGACIINDVTALKDPAMARLAAAKKTGVVLMHMKGSPRTMQKKPSYRDTVKEVYDFLDAAVNRAQAAGIDRDRIIVDVGIGFGKRLSDNLTLIKHLYEFKALGRPILIGTSRKSFIGSVLKQRDPGQRLAGSLASLVISVLNGAKILRVHDLVQARQAITMADSILSSW
ncbi:dihydropteroate synthase [Candidatus Omnitrophota bacterium]